jgi:hypothetical protein
VKHQFPPELEYGSHPKLPDNSRYYSSSNPAEQQRGRKTEPYPKPVRRKQIYSPPPKKKTSKGDHRHRHAEGRAIGDEKRMMTSKKSHRGHDPSLSHGRQQRSRGSSHGHRSSHNISISNRERQLVLHQEAEAMMQQVGQGVMNELTKVVDTVSTDLRLVSEQLKNLSNSMSESMLLSSSFARDPDLSMTSHGHIHSLVVQQQGKQGGDEHSSPPPPPQSLPNAIVIHQSTPERKQSQQQKHSEVSPDHRSRDTRYQQQQLYSSDDSNLLEVKETGRGELLQREEQRYSEEEEEDPTPPEDDEVLSEMIRNGLKQKLLGLISQTMVLNQGP